LLRLVPVLDFTLESLVSRKAIGLLCLSKGPACLDGLEVLLLPVRAPSQGGVLPVRTSAPLALSAHSEDGTPVVNVRLVVLIQVQ
jgi:hypothetical protein